MRTRRQTRRRVLGSTTIAGGLLLAACGAPAPAAEQVNTNPTTGGEIAWWMLTNNQNEPQILQEQVFKDYLRDRPQVKLAINVISGWDTVNSKLLAAMAAGTPPDIARIKDYWTSDYVSRDSLLPLDPYVKADKIDLVAKHGTARLFSCQQDGKTYALPFTTVSLHQYFNADLLREYGYVKGTTVTPPDTWQERREMAVRMTDRARDRWGSAHRSYGASQSTTTDYMQFAMQNGVEWMNADRSKFTFNTPEGIETLQYLQDMVWKDQSTIPPDYKIDKPKETGKVALWTEGAWQIPAYRSGFPDLKFGVALNPQKKTRTLMVQGNNLAIFKDSKQRDLAWTAARHMNKVESDLLWNSAGGYPPVALANKDMPPFSTDPDWMTVMTQLGRPDSKPYPIVTNYQEMMNQFGEEATFALSNKKTAKDALADAQRRLQVLLDVENAKRK